MSDLILHDIEDSGDKRVVRHVQEVSDILKANYNDRKADGWGAGKNMHLAARIPVAVWLEWERLGITEEPALLKKAIEMHKEYKTINKKLI